MGYDKASYEQQTYSSYSREDLKDEIERLKAERDNWQETARVEHNANHTLRAQVRELGDQLKQVLLVNGSLSDERDALRLKLDAFQDTKPYVSKLIEDNNALRAELEHTKATVLHNLEMYRAELEKIKGEKMGVINLDIGELLAENARLKNNIEGLNYIIGKLEAELDEVRDEAHVERKAVAKLQAELAALKPVPVVVERYLFVTGSSGYADLDGQRVNVKVTYTDGVLTGAEVVSVK